MPENLTAGKKAARTRKLRAAAFKATQTRKRINAFTKARAAEAAGKEALRSYCAGNGWRVAFFEGETGAPRTGIIDAIMFRVSRKNADRWPQRANPSPRSAPLFSAVLSPSR